MLVELLWIKGFSRISQGFYHLLLFLSHSVFMRILLIAFFLIVPAVSAHAEPTVVKNVQYYDITGRDIPFLMGEMDTKGPRDRHSGRKVWAHTRWRIDWDAQREETRTSCKYADIKTVVRLDFIVPRWVNNDGVSQQVKKAWDRFYAALQKHEYKHAMHGVGAAQDIERQLLALKTEASCRILDKKAEEIVNKVIQEYSRKDLILDDQTKHGRTEGVVL